MAHAASRALLIVYAPIVAAGAVRQAIADAGGGRIGNYDACSFSVRGVGRFTPREYADPAIGEPGEPAATEEERIEVLTDAALIPAIVRAVRAVHPYDEPVIDAIACLEIDAK